MQEAFGIVIFVVVILGGIGAVFALTTSGAAYKQIGKGGLSINAEEQAYGQRQEAVMNVRAAAEQEAEIRQMLEARNKRRVARGEAPVDIEEEYARLTAPAPDPALEQEVRDLVIARNKRRRARGKEPLDVEAEVARQLRELG